MTKMQAHRSLGPAWRVKPITRVLCVMALAAIFLVNGCSEERTSSTQSDTHPKSWMDSESLDFHGQVVTAGDPDGCRECHGDDFDGGEVEVSCIECHTESGACTVCHGGQDNLTGAPPIGLRGELSDSTLAVGAHTTHLTTSEVAAGAPCDACHLVPIMSSDSGHFGNDTIAEITWHGISDAGSAEWDRETGACRSTYCHGDFSGGNDTNVPIWTATGQAECGSCHDVGDDPELLGWKHAFHVEAAGLGCVECHATVVDADLQITAINLHVNGVVDTLTRDTIVCGPCHGAGEHSCTGCHGGDDNNTGAPPTGLRGETATSDLAVGAHTTHLEDGEIAAALECGTCHVVPLNIEALDHLGADSVAEVSFGGIAGELAEWDRIGATCKQTYCHGNFAAGDSLNVPIWTANNQAECGSCHDVGANPWKLGGIHSYHILSAGFTCGDCHAEVANTLGEIIDINLHVNGEIDTQILDQEACDVCHAQGQVGCTVCHGGDDNQTGAPPQGIEGETATTDLAVGAHTIHVDGGAQSNAIPCNTCHVRPESTLDAGHLGADSVAEISWGGISGEQAAWDRIAATCEQTYCHGNFDGGATNNAPIWTSSGQATCGSCHDAGNDPALLGWEHEFHVGSAGLGCSECHANVVDAQLNIIDRALHVDGTVDTLTRDQSVCDVCHQQGTAYCNECHGGADNSTGAPPTGIEGETATTELAVGAHTSHVEGGSQADAFDCTECHTKPSAAVDPGHFGVDSVAEITWGGLTGGATLWNRNSATCSQSYCHGNFAGGATNNAPIWTSNNQAACGSCHDVGADPASLGWEHEFHVVSGGLSCGECHADVVDGQLAITNRSLHVNGVVNTRTRDQAVCNVCHEQNIAHCTECHGGSVNQTGAPPTGIEGETATTDLAVGAHTAHVTTSARASAYDCTECHTKPQAAVDPGHFGVDSVAEISWGAVAGDQSTWNRQTAACSNTYCHGNFAGGNAANTPVWTSSGQAACGSCHDIGAQPSNLRWKHEFHVGVLSLPCGECHANVVDVQLNITSPTLHANGVVDTLTRDFLVCTSCHGPEAGSCTTCHGGVDNQTGAPPQGIEGETATTELAVGAHTIHLEGGPVAAGFSCTECHVVPAGFHDPGHVGDDFIAEITFGSLAGPSATWSRTDSTCADSYCHGNFPGGDNSPTPLWTESGLDLCGSCHDNGVDPDQLSGKHKKHIIDKDIECYQCHSTTVDAGLNILYKWVHVDGVKTVSFSSGQGTWANGECSNTGCHETEDW